MELEIKRTNFKENYTLGFLRESGQKNFLLNVVEPPISGFALPHSPVAYPRGKYKLFLKPSSKRLGLVPVLQSVRGYERMAIEHSEQALDDLLFVTDNGLTPWAMWLGRIRDRVLRHDDYNFQRFLYRLIIAKQNKEVLWLNII